MKAYAVIQTGGKQYRVEAGEILSVERLEVKEGDKMDTFPVLAVSDGATLTLGKPHVVGAKVTVTLEISAEVPSGVPDQAVRTVTENSRTLKFSDQGFEKE